MICKHCKGVGVEGDFRYIELAQHMFIKTKMCPVCLGEGKLDWVEEITGKKRQLKQTDVLFEHGEELLHHSSSVVGSTDE